MERVTDLESSSLRLGTTFGINIGMDPKCLTNRTMKKSKRVFYEVIQEQRPCRLYFDLEYDVNLNPQVDGESMINDFKEFIIQALKQTFDISITHADIVDLESSSKEKFSRHLIVHTGNYMFSSNYQVNYCFRLLKRIALG